MSDILTGAATGAGIGGSFGGPLGAGIGAGIGALAGLLSDIGKDPNAEAKITEAQAKADISTYQAYLDQFPGYAAAKESQFQTQENQILGDRLAAMGMHGQTSGGAGAPTSAATVYGQEKSLWDQGYTQLVNSLNLDKTKAENQLEVAKKTAATAEESQHSGLFGHGGFLGMGI